MKVNIKELRRRLSKLLNEPILEITRNSEVIGIYQKRCTQLDEISPKNPERCTQSPKTAKKVYTANPNEVPENTTKHQNTIKPKKVYTANDFKPVFIGRTGAYGCGCMLTSSKLCPKHKRI